MKQGLDHSGTLENPAPNPECTLELEGSAGRGCSLRSVLAIPLAALGVWCCKLFADTPTKNPNDAEAGWLYGAILCFVIAACLPFARRKLMDLHRREWVNLKYYAGFQTSKAARSFDEFDAIVLRHLVHESEGDSSYTGSVGFRPRDGGAVLWLKDFKATPDQIPEAAVDFAREISELTGLPQHRPERV